MEADVLKTIFEPRSIAFIGASTNAFKWGFNILHNLIRSGYEGKVYPVNPQLADWFGRPVYNSLDEIDGEIDLAVIVVKDSLVLKTIEACVRKNIPDGIIITAGFSETGSEGARLEKEVIEVARKGGMRLVGPNTMGIFSAYPSCMQALMTSMFIKPGHVALIAQSGNLGVSIGYRFVRRQIGLSRLISSGNEADLKTEEYLDYLEQDEKTKIICIYLEGIRNGKRFFESAQRISKTKPIVLLKGGRTNAGAKAAMSHTGAIASDDSLFGAVCRQVGIIQVEDMDEMVDVAGLLLAQPPLKGNRIGIITLGGGWGVVATDRCILKGFEIPPLNNEIITRLDKVLPKFWSRGNPIDLVAPGTVDVITDSVSILMDDENIDAVLVMGLGYMTLRAGKMLTSEVVPRNAVEKSAHILISEEKKLFEMLAGIILNGAKPVIPVIDLLAYDLRTEDGPVDYLEKRGMISFPSPVPAINALSKVLEYWKTRL